MQAWSRRIGQIGLAGFLVVLVLAGCAEGGFAGASPEDVHRQWVEAMRDNQRDVLLELVAPQAFQQAFVDDNLRSIQADLAREDWGGLQTLDTLPLTDVGAGKHGLSRWTFASGKQLCHRTELTAIDGEWKVLRFDGIGRCSTT